MIFQKKGNKNKFSQWPDLLVVLWPGNPKAQLWMLDCLLLGLSLLWPELGGVEGDDGGLGLLEAEADVGRRVAEEELVKVPRSGHFLNSILLAFHIQGWAKKRGFPTNAQ